jgi:hypothetical protein
MRSTVSGEAEAAAARIPAGGVLWGPSTERERMGGRDGFGIRAFEYRDRIRLPEIDTRIFICSAPYGLNPTGGPVSGSKFMVPTCARRPKAAGARPLKRNSEQSQRRQYARSGGILGLNGAVMTTASSAGPSTKGTHDGVL